MSTFNHATILLAEEDDSTRTFLYENLSADGYQVLSAPDRAKALALLSTAHPDLIVVDVNGQTLELLDAIRSGDAIAGAADPTTPLIALSRDADRLQRIRMLERGSDDVVKKPFAYPELRARIAAVLRRSRSRRSARLLRAGPLTIDLVGREVRVGERRVRLTAKEYELLVALASEPSRVTRARSWCGACGGIARRRGRSTATPHGCARSCARPASRARQSTCGASATG